MAFLRCFAKCVSMVNNPIFSQQHDGLICFSFFHVVPDDYLLGVFHLTRWVFLKGFWQKRSLGLCIISQHCLTSLPSYECLGRNLETTLKTKASCVFLSFVTSKRFFSSELCHFSSQPFGLVVKLHAKQWVITKLHGRTANTSRRRKKTRTVRFVLVRNNFMGKVARYTEGPS